MSATTSKRSGFVQSKFQKNKQQLQYTATHCNTLQRTATHCNTLPILVRHESDDSGSKRICAVEVSKEQTTTATHCNTLQRTATNCNTLPILVGHESEDSGAKRIFAVEVSKAQTTTAIHCNTLQHIATHCNTLQHTANPSRPWERGQRIEEDLCGRSLQNNLNSQLWNKFLYWMQTGAKFWFWLYLLVASLMFRATIWMYACMYVCM